MEKATIREIMSFPMTPKIVKQDCEILIERGIVTPDTIVEKSKAFIKNMVLQHIDHNHPVTPDEKFIRDMVRGVCLSVPTNDDRKTLKAMANPCHTI